MEANRPEGHGSFIGQALPEDTLEQYINHIGCIHDILSLENIDQKVRNVARQVAGQALDVK